MPANRREQIEDLYQAVLAQPPEKQSELLRQARSRDPELCDEVESRLYAEGEETSFSDDPPLEADTEAEEPSNAFGLGGAAAGTVIGPYKLIQRVGQGGMGEVWLADQRLPVRRRVALKLIKAGMDTREVVARFESERQALALMDHPAIAKVFDAGSTPQGRPYFVMEYVSGIPITEYCDKHKLNMRQRLELFLAVCDGVQHAHQKAILHRDLKPSNILVAEVDGKPAPRIIDFGVAKATAQRLTADTMFTQVGAIIGTPGYMSPEQADSGGADVDTRTDVYSLGVVLYQLLVGVPPADFSRTPRDEFARKLREQDTPRPSTRLRGLGGQAGAAAQNRGADRPTLERQLRGDLDAVTLKALEKERSRRYASPSDLAADIGRYLRHEPVLARPASAVYRAGKYVRRHRVGAAAAAGLLVVLISFGAAQALQLRRTTRARDRADRIATFMTRMFKVSDPSAARGNSITAREILDRASREIDTGLSKDPVLQAEMMQTMGDVYQSLGLYPQAQSLFTQAIEIRRRVLGGRAPETLTSMSALVGNLTTQGRYPEAEKLDRETLDLRRRVLGPDHPDTLNSMSAFAALLAEEGRYAEAEKVSRESLDIQRRVLGPDHPDTVRSMNNLANALDNEGRYAEAEQLKRETLDIERRVSGPEHPDTLRSMNNLAAVLDVEGKYPEAETLYRATLDTRRRILGPEHPDSLRSTNALGALFIDEGRYAEAEKLFRQSLEGQRRVLGPDHPDTQNSMHNLAEVLAAEGRFADSEKLVREALAIELRTVGPDHRNTLLSMSNLVDLLEHEGRYAEAEKLGRETVDGQRRVLGPEHPDTLTSTDNLAIVLSAEGRVAEAEKLLRETLAVQRRVLGPRHPDAAVSTYDLGCILARKGNRDEAFSLLWEAVDNGLAPGADLAIEKDPDLKSLRRDPRFAALVVHAGERAAAARKPR
jgi:non-specific serine/threonine protein kinase/serine/threonine-protein kinase